MNDESVLAIVVCVAALMSGCDDVGVSDWVDAVQSGDCEHIVGAGAAGVDVDQELPCWDGRSALAGAVVNSDSDLIACLLRAGASPNAIDSDGYSALMLAVENGDREAVKLLLGAGASILGSGDSGVHAYGLASSAGAVDMLEEFEAAGFREWDANCGRGDTCLHIACGAGQMDVVSWLLKRGCNVDMMTNSGQTALGRAVLNSKFDVARLLIQHGAHLEAEARPGLPLMTMVCYIGQDEAVAFLLDAGCDPTSIRRAPRLLDLSVFEAAVAGASLSTIAALLRAGCNVTDRAMELAREREDDAARVEELIVSWPGVDE